MASPETCRDVLAEMLAAASNMSDPADVLWAVAEGDRIRAAMAVDDAERERVTKIETAARRFAELYGQACKRGPRPDLGGMALVQACAELFGALLPPTMRQLNAAQRIAAEMPALRRGHARMAVEVNSHPDGCHSTDRTGAIVADCDGDGHHSCKTCERLARYVG